MTSNHLTLLTICLMLNVSSFFVSARKEITFVQVLSVNKFYGPSNYLNSNSTAFEAKINLNYEYFLKHAVDIPNSVKMNLFNLGSYLRKTYDTFLGGLYFDELMKMQTTEFPVSIIAGELINAGLWPPVEQQIWKEDLAWQPIPFEYLPMKEDQIILGTLCPNFEYETQAVLKKHNNLSAEHQNLLKYINREAQLNLKNPIDVSLFYLAVESGLEFNKTLPEWLNKIYPSDALLSLAMQAYDLLSKTTLQKRLNGGSFLKHFIQDSRSHMNKGSVEARKINIYSGDERNLAGVLNNLNLPNYDLPKAGAALIFELYAENGKYFIKLNYYTGADKETLNLVLAGCQMFCPFEQFVDALKDVLPENEMSLCGGSLVAFEKGSSAMLHPTWVVANIVGMFFESNYSSNVLIQMDINVVEKQLSGQSFEFSPALIEVANALTKRHFPEMFFFGAAASAYQIEGAYDSPEKGLSVWDYWTHANENLINDKSNGDVACNSFYKYADDVDLIKNLGGNIYRISLSWSRILPNGFSNSVSREGIQYYNQLINSMLLNDITPMVAIHHFDIPYKLQLLGGWANPLMVQYFQDYAKVAFTYFGDRVKYWITISDPWLLCNHQFGNPLKPFYDDTAIGNYLCGHHVLLAHERAYSLYRNEFQWLQRGQVGLSIDMRWFEPENPTLADDVEAAEISYQFANYWFLNPLLHPRGDYPDPMRLKLDIKSAEQHYKRSRLPTFTGEELERIRSSLDFLGIDFFTTYSAHSLSRDAEPSVGNDSYLNNESMQDDIGARWLPYEEAFGAFDIKNTPENFGKLLRRLNNDYILPKVIITANGYADFGESYDIHRAIYYYDHISELFKVMKDGMDIRGYITWSLMDSFEWFDGYRKHFGLYGVDFNNASRPRTEKLSTNLIRNIFKSKTVPTSFTTDRYTAADMHN